jgi:DNA-binding XRE family transcriptional regulator
MKLLAIRTYLGMSQFTLAKLLDPDLPYPRLSEFETGRCEPNLLHLLHYARLANCSLEQLIDDGLDLPPQFM